MPDTGELAKAINDAESQLQAMDQRRIQEQARRRQAALQTISTLEEAWRRAHGFELESIRLRADEALRALEGMEMAESEVARARVLIVQTANAEMGEIERRRLAESTTANRQAAETVARFYDQAADRIGGALTDMYVRGEGAAVSFRNVALAAVSEIHQAFIRLALLNPLRNALFGGDLPTLGSLFGGGGSGIGGAAPVSRLMPGGALVDLFHTGGKVGEPRPQRMVPFAALQNAERYHMGGIIGRDEVPAILQKGETVLPRGARAGGVTINQTFTFAAGASMPDRAAMRQFAREIRESTIAAVRDGRMRDPGFFGGG